MAQLGGMRRYGESKNSPPSSTSATNSKTPINTRFAHYNPKSPTTMATIEQLLQGSGGGGREGYSRWHSNASPTAASNSTSPGSRRNHDQEVPTPVLKKSPSVISRVKEKAKKWRRTLSSRKKPTYLAADPNPTPSRDVSLDDIDDDDKDQEEDPEYFGAPMYESELAPESYKETARQHPRAVHVVSEKHVLASSEKHHHTASPDKTASTETMQTSEQKQDETPANGAREKLEPAISVVADAASESLALPCDAEAKATEEVTSKIQDLSVSAPCPPRIATTDQTSSPDDQVWDKGISVKEYLMQKLEPGDDEKALSQIISDAISPRIGAANVGVVEKVKVAVNSLLRTDQVSSSAENSSSGDTASANGHEVGEEESRGRAVEAK